MSSVPFWEEDDRTPQESVRHYAKSTISMNLMLVLPIPLDARTNTACIRSAPGTKEYRTYAVIADGFSGTHEQVAHIPRAWSL